LILTTYTCRDEYHIDAAASSIDADTDHFMIRHRRSKIGTLKQTAIAVSRSLIYKHFTSNGSSVQPLAERHDCLFIKQSAFQTSGNNAPHS
ncbi:hypothetical protein G9A89_000514, partial [Geosiphon pyriformis]